MSVRICAVALGTRRYSLEGDREAAVVQAMSTMRPAFLAQDIAGPLNMPGVQRFSPQRCAVPSLGILRPRIRSAGWTMRYFLPPIA